MKKNPLTRLLAFDNYCLCTHVSTEAQYLWIKLFIVSVRNFQPKQIEISNSQLSSMLNCTDKTSRRIRDELVEKNLLIYENKGTRHNGLYILKFPFENEKDYGKNYPNSDPNQCNSDDDYGKIYLNKSDYGQDYGKNYPNSDPNQTLQLAKQTALQPSQIRKDSSSYSYIYTTNNFLSLEEESWFKFMSCYNENIDIFPNGVELDNLVSYYDEFGLELMLFAIDYVKSKNAKSPKNYLKAVLNSWAKRKITSVEQAKLDVEHHDFKKIKNSPVYGADDEKLKNGEIPF